MLASNEENTHKRGPLGGVRTGGYVVMRLRKMHGRPIARAAAIVAAGCVLAVSLGIGSARAEQFSPAVQSLIAAATKEGSLTLSWGSLLGSAKGAEEFQAMVNKRFGANLKFDFSPAAGAAPRMAVMLGQELAAKRPASTDILPVGITFSNRNTFLQIDWREYLPDLPPYAMKYEMHGLAFATLLIGITYNTDLVPKDMVPTSLRDLLNPMWKDKIAARVSTTFMSYLALPDVMGRDGAVAFFGKFGKQARGMIRCGTGNRVASGEFVMFFPDCGDYEARSDARLGMPLAHVIPSEGAGMAFWPAAIPKNAAHPNAAKLFLIELMSREGQDFVWKTDATDFPGIPGSHIAPIIAQYKAKGIKFIDIIEAEIEHPEIQQAQKDMLKALQASIQK
jgi:iron(III) transport system substrate-binding protein